jgi:hypothetical protein
MSGLWLLGRLLCGALAAVVLGCAVFTPADPFDEMHPYIWPRGGQVTLLTCRFTTARPVGVSIEGADEEEEEAAELALDAWERAGLGLRFVRVAEEDAQIRIRWLAGEVMRSGGSQAAGRSIVDCGLNEEGAPRAEIVRARVELPHAIGPDWRGHSRRPSQEERVGRLAHELGHALGFQGHVTWGDDAMQAAPESIRRVGKRLLSGGTLSGGAVAALYARPSGAVIERVSVGDARTDLVDRMHAVARGAGLAGPFLRVGDRAARVFWRDAKAREYGIGIPALAKAYAHPEQIVLLPEARTRVVLPRERDAKPDRGR